MNAKTLAAILVTVPDAEVVIVSYRHPGSMAPAVVTYDINYVCIEESEGAMMKRSSVGTQMANYSHVFPETIDEFVSPVVPGDQADARKGQVTARAGYKIHLTNPNVGYIGKNPGQTQYHGIAVDALTDRSDGTGADYLTDILQPDGPRLIAVAYTPYPHQNVPPEAGWVEPTEVYLTYPGPLTMQTPDTEAPHPWPRE